MISELIDKQDSFEIIRDQIVAILVNEIANQKALAIAAGKDPTLWDLKIYLERSNPWEQWLNQSAITTPIVNVWYDSLTFDKSNSDVVKTQMADASYNIDIYGFGLSSNTVEGHDSGDEVAGLEAHRALRLVRNILMAAENTYLQLRGLVWGRWCQSITSFQPQLNNRQMQEIVGARIKFEVSFNEFSPQYVPQILETLTATVNREEDGEVLLITEYDYTV